MRMRSRSMRGNVRVFKWPRSREGRTWLNTWWLEGWHDYLHNKKVETVGRVFGSLGSWSLPTWRWEVQRQRNANNSGWDWPWRAFPGTFPSCSFAWMDECTRWPCVDLIVGGSALVWVMSWPFRDRVTLLILSPSTWPREIPNKSLCWAEDQTKGKRLEVTRFLTLSFWLTWGMLCSNDKPWLWHLSERKFNCWGLTLVEKWSNWWPVYLRFLIRLKQIHEELGSWWDVWLFCWKTSKWIRTIETNVQILFSSVFLKLFWTSRKNFTEL